MLGTFLFWKREMRIFFWGETYTRAGGFGRNTSNAIEKEKKKSFASWSFWTYRGHHAGKFWFVRDLS